MTMLFDQKGFQTGRSECTGRASPVEAAASARRLPPRGADTKDHKSRPNTTGDRRFYDGLIRSSESS